MIGALRSVLGWAEAIVPRSWNNLTNKGLIRELPDVATVWNEAMRREATGFKTSAMLEAAILGKRIHTLLVSGFDEGQEGTPHF